MFVKAKGVDKPGWNTGIFIRTLRSHSTITASDIGINEKWSVELNFDHTKYQIPDQTLHITGTYKGKSIEFHFCTHDRQPHVSIK